MEIPNDIFQVAGTSLLAAGGYMIARVNNKIDFISDRLRSHETEIAKEYVSKSDFVHAVDEFKDNIKAANLKLDKIFDMMISK